MTFSLERFEALCHTRQHEAAAQELLSFLAALDANHGAFGGIFDATPSTAMARGDEEGHVLTRLTSAMSTLLADRGFVLTAAAHASFLTWHRWIGALFAASPFRNADHVIHSLNVRGPGSANGFEIAGGDLARFGLCHSNESSVPVDWDGLWQHDRRFAAGLAMVQLSSRFMGTPVAHARREMLLPWLAQRLAELDDLSGLPLAVLHDVHMGSSYADGVAKHDLKAPINRLVRRQLAQAGLVPRVMDPVPAGGGRRPCLLVVVEWMTQTHSIYRTHSRTLEAARQVFDVVGVGSANHVDAAGRAVFDRFVDLTPGSLVAQLTQIRSLAAECRADVLYMPSVGMSLLTIYLANLRVAPLQAMGLGHPATTHSDQIDVVLVEEDFVGDPRCFSEALLTLPRDGMPYRPSGEASDVDPVRPDRRGADTVRIAVPATPMKLNPWFLAACAQVRERATCRVEFHFLVGQAVGLVAMQVRHAVRQVLGDAAVVHPHQAYAAYMATLAQCDVFFSPFPFGNTNGLVDAVSAGLVGVCRTGPEVHEHIDGALFARLGFPSWLVAVDTAAYVAAAVRLIDDPVERNALRASVAGPGAVEVLFQGRAELLGQRLFGELQRRGHWPVDAVR